MRTTTHGRFFALRQKKNFIVISFFAFIFLTSCKTETLFQSNFDASTVGQRPAAAQTVGTVAIDGPTDAVLVIPSPVVTGGKWVKVTRHANPQSVSGMQCNLTKQAGAGLYNFSAIMFIPSGNTGPSSVQFEPFGQQLGTLTSFLHLDFMPDGSIRLDDNPDSTFGHYPLDASFIVQVTLNINATATPTAHIVLAGAGASGIRDYTILSPFIGWARQFGAVRFWMGSPWTESFDATTIVVTRRNN
jgi:hypothetical protein